MDVGLRMDLLEVKRLELQSSQILPKTSVQQGARGPTFVVPRGVSVDDGAVTPPESPRLPLEHRIALETDPQSPWNIVRANSALGRAAPSYQSLNFVLQSVDPSTRKWLQF